MFPNQKLLNPRVPRGSNPLLVKAYGLTFARENHHREEFFRFLQIARTLEQYYTGNIRENY